MISNSFDKVDLGRAMRLDKLAHGLERYERLVIAALLAAIIVAAFPQIVFFGRSLVPTDNYNPLAASYGAVFDPGPEWQERGLLPYPNLHDSGGSWWQGEPALIFFRKALLSGQLPFWDPSAACGAPAYCNLTSEFLFPPQIALSLLGATSGQKNFYILFLFWAASFATYCLLRLHHLGVMPSLGGGIAFLFSGAVQQVVPSIFMGQALVAMPCLLLGTRWFLNEPSWPRTAGLAGIYAFFSLASFPPILFAAFGMSVFYVACSLALEGRNRWRIAARRYAIGAVLSLGLVAIYYGPVFMTMSQVEYVTEWYRSAAVTALKPWAIFGLFSPTAAGGSMVYAPPFMPDYGSHLFYVGTVALLCAILAVGRCAGQARTLLFAGTIGTGLVLLKIFGLPPSHWIVHIPILQSIHYAQYFGILVAFLLSLLAGLGLDRLIRSRAGIQLGLAVGLSAAALAALWLFAERVGALRQAHAWRWISDYNLLVAFTAAAAGVASLCFLRRGAARAIAGAGLLLLIGIEGAINATYPRQPQTDVFAHPPKYVGVLQALPRPFRLFTVSAFNANIGSAFDIDVLDSLYMFSPPRIYNIYQQYAEARTPITMREANRLPPDAVLERAGIGYILSRRRRAESLPRQYPVAYQDELVTLFRRGNPPRYLFTSDYQVTDRRSALQLIATAPQGQVLLESSPPFGPALNQPDDPVPEVVSNGLNHTTLKLRVPRAGLLYIADAYADGWSAKVNGKASPIVPANYGFRAIMLEPGDARVELRYLPPGLVGGAIISVICLGLTVGLARYGRRAI